MYGVRHNVFGSFLNFTFVENPGIAFGIELPTLLKLLLSIFSGIISIGLIWYLFKQRNETTLFRLSIGLIIGGALGNFIDRLLYGVLYGYAPLFFGKVVDFIEVKFFTMSFFGYTFDHLPIFNLADLAVAAGVSMFIFFHKKLLPDNDKSNFSIERQVNIEPTD